MCNKNTENKANRRELILQHLTKWKPAYELAGVLSVITVICFGGISIRQTQKSLRGYDRISYAFEQITRTSGKAIFAT